MGDLKTTLEKKIYISTYLITNDDNFCKKMTFYKVRSFA